MSRVDFEDILNHFRDERITDILINGMEACFIERAGSLEAASHFFSERSQLERFVEWLALQDFRVLDIRKPAVDGQIRDVRFHIVHFPIVRKGPVVSLRRALSLDQAEVCVHPDVFEALKVAVKSRKNILIAGATGSGKTTLLRMLAKHISHSERVVLLEESGELELHHPHVVKLESRIGGLDGLPNLGLDFLLKNALRMRPDRILVGECRGTEAFEYLQSLRTGHDGSLCTLHAGSATDALYRIEMLALLAQQSLPLSEIRALIAESIHIVCFVERSGFQRRLAAVADVVGLSRGRYQMAPWIVQPLP